MTNLADWEVRRNKLVSRFSNVILLPVVHSMRLINSWKSCPCGFFVPYNSTVSLVKEIKLDWFWHRDCVHVLHVPFWSSQYSFLGLSVGRPTASIHFSSLQYWVCSALGTFVKTWPHRTVPSAQCRKIFLKRLEMCPNSQSLLVNAFAGINFQTRWGWNFPIDKSFGFGAVLNLTGECSLVAIARSLMSAVMTRLQDLWYSHPRLRNSWLLWRFLCSNHHSCCRF